MCATRAVLVLLFAVIACAVAIPAAVPQPASPAAGATVGIQQRGLLEKRQIDGIAPEAGAENGQDLKGSSSYGYGFYGGYPGWGYRPYWGGYPYYGGYPYGYPYYYRSYYPYYRSYYGYGLGGFYGGW